MMLGGRGGKRVIKGVIKLVADASGEPVHPMVDVLAMLSMLAGPRLTLPTSLLVNDNTYAEVAYAVSLRNHEIAGIAGVLLVGASRVVTEAVKKYELVAPTVPAVIDRVTKEVYRVQASMTRFPRILVVVAQMVPSASMVLLYDTSWRKKHGKIYGSLAKQSAVPLTPLLRLVSDAEYGGVHRVVDMAVCDDDTKNFENLYMAVISDTNVTTFLLIANAYRTTSLLYGSMTRYRKIGVVARAVSEEHAKG